MSTKLNKTTPQASMPAENDDWLLTRRTFMIGSVSGGLIMGFGGLLSIASAQTELAAKRFSPAVWFEMDANGITTINIAKAEMVNTWVPHWRVSWLMNLALPGGMYVSSM